MGNKGDFNKYYISPNKRYKTKTDNPKNKITAYENEDYVYNNLHNYDFWNWVHPLDEYQLKKRNRNISEQVNLPVL